MIRRFVGAVAAAVGLVAGLWLILAPVALGTQPAGLDAAWNDPTITEFTTGAAVAVVGLVGLIAFAVAIRGEAVRRGLVGRGTAAAGVEPADREPEAEYGARHAEEAVRETPAAPAETPAGSDDDQVADLLAPLVRALAEDMGGVRPGGGANPPAPPANGGYTAYRQGGDYR